MYEISVEPDGCEAVPAGRIGLAYDEIELETVFHTCEHAEMHVAYVVKTTLLVE